MTPPHPYAKRGIRAVHQAPDHPEIPLHAQLDVNQDEGHVEPRQERLPHDGPGADCAEAVDGRVRIGGIDGATVGAPEVRGVIECAALRAACESEDRVVRTPPKGRRLLIRDWYWTGSGAQRTTPASLSAVMSSHSYPSSVNKASVSSPCSGALRKAGGCPSNCTGTAGKR